MFRLFKQAIDTKIILKDDVNIFNGIDVDQLAVYSPDESDEWSKILSCVSNQLQILTKESEDEFLMLGQNLQSIATQANEISEMTLSAATFLSGKEIIGSIEELQDILERIDRYFQFCGFQTEDDIEILKTIQELVITIHNPLKGFARLIKRLSVLAMSTRIENARLNNENIKFENLVNDVSNLSVIIEEKIKSIDTGAKSLSNLSELRLENIVILKEKQFKQAAEIIKGLQDCLFSLSETHSHSSNATQAISEISSQIPNKINEIVMSLQSHDIIRQKIEHVAESVDHAYQILQSSPDIPNQDKVKNVQQINSILNLQFNQLQSVGKEISIAIIGVIESLRDISHSVVEMSREAGNLITGSDKDRQSVMQLVQSGISNVTKSLFANVQASVELAEEMQGVGVKIQEMDGFVGEINYVGTEIELISLNGLIHAAHLGQEGASLSVLADSIQKLSVDAHVQIVNVADTLKNIVQSTDGKRFEGNAGNELESVKGVVQEMVDELGGFVDSLHNVTEKVESTLNQINEIASPFAYDINKHIDSITVHSLFDRIISETSVQIRTVLDQLVPYVKDISQDDIKKHLEDLENQYTMNSERYLHESYVTQEEAKELVEHVPMVTESQDHDLGDNIELF